MLGLTTPFCFSSSAVQGENTYVPYTPGFHVFSTDVRQLLISSIKKWEQFTHILSGTSPSLGLLQ